MFEIEEYSSFLKIFTKNSTRNLINLQVLLSLFRPLAYPI